MENQPGALSRVVGLFSQRGYNIETLVVAPTNDPTLSRLTMSTEGDEKVVEQEIEPERHEPSAESVAHFLLPRPRAAEHVPQILGGQGREQEVVAYTDSFSCGTTAQSNALEESAC